MLLNTCDATLLKLMVWPSGAARTTRETPMVPPAPPTFSTITGWPSDTRMRSEKIRPYKLARTLRSEPSVIPAVFAHTDATTVRAVVVVVVSSITPPMLCVPLVSKMVGVLAAPSAEHCVGQLGYLSSVRRPRCQEQQCDTGEE